MDINLHEIPNMSGVYIIKCLANFGLYIGSTNNLHQKLKTYMGQLENANCRMEELNEDIRKYGLDNIELEVLTSCNYKIVRLIERYYIKKYNAIGLGYNKINASKNLLKEKYEYNTSNKRAMQEKEINYIMEEIMIDIFDYSNSEINNVISVETLCDLLENDFGIVIDTKRFHLLFEVFRRLDITTFIKDTQTGFFYEISGNQMWNYIRWRTFKSDNTINNDIKYRLCSRVIDCDNLFIECPKYKGINGSVNVKNIDEFRLNNTIIDAMYKAQYKKEDEKYTRYFYEF